MKPTNIPEKLWLVLEGDWGGQEYLTCPCSLIGDNAQIEELLRQMDDFAWPCNEGDGAYSCFSSVDVGVYNLQPGLWVHEEFHTPINDPTEAGCHCCRSGLHVRQNVHNLKWFKRITKLLDLDNPNKKIFHEET